AFPAKAKHHLNHALSNPRACLAHKKLEGRTGFLRFRSQSR
ncbi:unnamed protein product, partial [Mycena citricolor]